MRNLSFAHVGSIRPIRSFSTFYPSFLYVTTLISIVLLFTGQQAVAQTFPASFSGVQLATGFDPVAMDIAPDGRIFLTEKSGKIRIVKNGALLSTSFITIPNIDNAGERGLLGIALDPNFSSTNFVYVYYTYKATGSTVSNNRVSRFTANGDVAVSGSELVLLNIEALSSASNHNGGSLVFKEGKLLITVGDNANGTNAQVFTTPKGKVLRLNPDGTIPSDNPYYGSTTGNNRAIWALGLRNPFNIAIQPGTGRVFINDVGENTYEEINEGSVGKNYGWPGIEGLRTTQTPPANYQDPFYVYSHSSGCSITAGEFYNPSTAQFPAEYVGKYFFADYCGGWIKTIDLTTKAVTTFVSGLSSPIAIKTGQDGSLYFMTRGNNGALWKVNYTGSGLPGIASQPASKTASVGESVTFSVSASGTPAPTYQWQRNNVAISGATSATYVIPNVTLSDNNAVFKVVISNSVGNVISNEATLTVLDNQKPTATIITPTVGNTYKAGDVITFSGSGTDPEDGALPASALTWKVDFYHYDNPAHFHPALAPVSGISSGSFTIPTSGETSPNVLYRIYLIVTDSRGATTTNTVDVNPIRSAVTLVTQPAGLTVKFDGAIVTTPFTFTGVSGIIRNLEAVDQSANGSTYKFYSWSDGGAATRTLTTPAVATTITATYTNTTLPDLTPLLYVRPTVQYGTEPFNVVVDVAELNFVPTNGSFSVKVTKDAKFNLTFPTSATLVGGHSVQNSAWSFSASDPNYYVLSSSQSIIAGGRLSFGLIGTPNPSATTGSMAVSCTLQPASLVEDKLTNNIDVEKIEYFQQ